MLGLFLASLWLSATAMGARVFEGGPDAPDADRPPAFMTGSLRFWAVSGLGFGLAGVPLELLALDPAVTLILPALFGLLLGKVLWPLLEEPTGEVGLDWLAGTEGRAIRAIDLRRGKVVVVTDSGRIEVQARSGGEHIALGRPVLIAYVEDGVAYVMAC